MVELLTITKALSDENRVRLIYALRDRELCVCQLTEFLNLAQATVSKHLSILSHAQLVVKRKKGHWAYYRIADKNSPKVIKDSISLICNTLSKSPSARADMKRLRKIIKIDPEALCRKQHDKQ